jgi:hypothetical protein
MTLIEAIQMANATGVLAGGFGLLKWGLTVERRLLFVELKTGIRK